MYKLHLILKYLFKRRIAWVSLVAVTLCTAMVLVVISVMGGWLEMFRDLNHGLVGDVVIHRAGATGFGHYEEILDAVRKMPQVQAAIPTIYSYGVINIDNQIQDWVQVQAYGDLDRVGQVNSFQRGLYRQYIEPMKKIQDDASLSWAEKQKQEQAIKDRPPSFDLPLPADVYKEHLPSKTLDASKLPGLIAGSSLFIQKKSDGTDTRRPELYTEAHWVKLTMLDITTASSMTPNNPTRTFWLIDDCRTKFYPVDSHTVYVPFDILQKDLAMASYTYQEKEGDKLVDRVEPGRVNEIQVKLKDGVDLNKGRDAIQQVVDATVANIPDSFEDFLQAQTWEQSQAPYISAIEHEKVLMTFLFGIISIVAIFLIFCIFYMIVAEKTRDIGIIKSVGASNLGVAQIFLGYGLTIGILGGGIGLLLAYLIIHNINDLHAWLGRRMGIVIWSPQTYLFDTIPNTMHRQDVIWIVGVAVLSALIGALVPAVRASRMNPVEALRWE